MENKEKNSNPNVNRAAYIAILTLLAVMAILVVATSTANRTRREEAVTVPPAQTEHPGTTPPINTKPSLRTTEPETTAAPEVTAPETTTASKPVTTAPPESTAAHTGGQTTVPVAETMPELLLPVNGNLLRAHDLEVPVYSTTMNDYRTHTGIDISAQMGASVCAAADGVIAQIWEDPMMGQCISIKHAGDGMTIYRNLSATLPVGIAEGVTVRAGQLIANIGESAMVEIAEEPHVHFEVMVGDDYVNPLDYLSASVKTSLAIDEGYEG